MTKLEEQIEFFLKGGSNPFQERGAWESTPLHHAAASSLEQDCTAILNLNLGEGEGV